MTFPRGGFTESSKVYFVSIADFSTLGLGDVKPGLWYNFEKGVSCDATYDQDEQKRVN